VELHLKQKNIFSKLIYNKVIILLFCILSFIVDQEIFIHLVVYWLLMISLHEKKVICLLPYL